MRFEFEYYNTVLLSLFIVIVYMGALESKNAAVAEYLKRFSVEEQQRISQLFKDLPNKCLDRDTFQNLVGNVLPNTLVDRIYNRMSPAEHDYGSFITYVSVILKGDYDEKKSYFIDLMTNGNETVLISELSKFLSDIALALCRQLETREEYRKWKFNLTDVTMHRIVQLLLNDLTPKAKAKKNESSIELSKSDMEAHLKHSSLAFEVLDVILQSAFHKLHPISHSATIKFPACSTEGYYSSLIDLSALLLLNHSLPPELQHQWRLLYSSNVHGEGFSTLLGKVNLRGPNFIIIKDKGGAVFGGFADRSWRLNPSFVGGANCFVFTLQPKLAAYFSTGYNENYMYLCQHQHTLANGLGFGGQMNNFGLWLASDFQHGHSTPSCSTYQSPQLSSEREFLLDTIEVWGVGNPVEPEVPKSKRSVLDEDVTARALLTIVDKVGASDGIREADAQTEREREITSSSTKKSTS